jgi:Flp pilus assembly protein TadG
MNSGDDFLGQTRATLPLARLRQDLRGNTLAIMAAAMIPLIAMIGSGVDMTRAYVAQNRFRQACDAGSLAGRRILAGLTVSSAARDEATKYFRFNFPDGIFQSAPYELTMSVPAAGTLKIESQTTIPTTVMKMFGFRTLPIVASCSATQDFVNTDIVLVFDLSGSMNCAPGGAGDCGGTEQSGSKIGALRNAAASLYDTLDSAQTQLQQNNLRLRYGFVNYNSSINVGRILYQKNPDWLVQNARYQSRTPDWVDATQYFNGRSACQQAYTYDAYVTQANPTYTGVMGGWWRGGNNCQVIAQSTARPDGYTYGVRTLDVRAYLASNLKATGATTPVPIWPIIGTNAPPDDLPYEKTSVWNGCIEERQTNSSAIDGGTSTTIPSDAYDLDVDLIPWNDATRWKPMWGDVVWFPLWATGGRAMQPDAPCPTESRRLGSYYNNRADFVSYVGSLTARGGTYHDLGMIWGARFLSSTGLFKSSTPETNDVTDPDNPAKIRGFSVKKYMIFMTDGEMAPTTTAYSAYGVEYMDGRVLGSQYSTDDAALKRRHLQRFRMACNAAKAKGIDVWVIAFATALTTDMTNCASKPGQAAGLSTNADLIAKFKEIGSKIGSLRISR